MEWMLERPDVAPVWHRFINHPFVLAMGNGTLPLESFKGYLVQDYLYLVSGSLPTLRTHGALEADSIYTPRYNLPAQTLSRATRPRTCGTSLPCVKILKSPVDRCSANEGHTRAGRRHRRAHRQGDCPAPHVLRGLWRLPGGDGGDRGEAGLHSLYKVRMHQALPYEIEDELKLTVAPTWPIDTSLISASPRTGLGYRSPWPRACWAMAPWRRCCMETRSRSGKGTITGTGSRTTLPMTTCKL